MYSETGLALFADAKNAAALHQGLVGDRSIVGYLRAHLSRFPPGDYFAMLAYLAMIDPHEAALQGMRCTHYIRRC